MLFHIFKFTLTITTFTFLFMSGAADLFAMAEMKDEDNHKTSIHAQRFNGLLRYTDPETKEEKLFKFSALKDETVALSSCGDTAKHLVITTDPKRFFEVGGENQNKVVMLFSLCQRMKQEINSSARPWGAIINKWDGDAGIFLRWGNDDNDERSPVSFLMSSPYRNISSQSLYDYCTLLAPLPPMRNDRINRIHFSAERAGRFRVDFEQKQGRARSCNLTHAH